MDFQSFKISFERRDQKRVHDCWDEVFASQRWTEGKFTALFEEKWARWKGVPVVATSSWAEAAMACMEYFELKGKKVRCPTNTFMATPLSVVKAGAEVVFADSNRDDLCLSYETLVSAAAQHDLAPYLSGAYRTDAIAGQTPRMRPAWKNTARSCRSADNASGGCRYKLPARSRTAAPVCSGGRTSTMACASASMRCHCAPRTRASDGKNRNALSRSHCTMTRSSPI